MTQTELLNAIQEAVKQDPGLLNLTVIRMAIRDLEGNEPRNSRAIITRYVDWE